MSDFDAEMLLERATLLGLISRDQANEARTDARDGTVDSIRSSLTRKQFLTSWQVGKLLKGEAAGFFFGGHEVLFHLAEGTFARVYRGRKQGSGEPVAIKVLRQRFTQDTESVERFNHEAEAGMKLVHQNIVRIYDYGAQDNRHYMIMEFVEGSNLRDFLRFRHRLEPAEAMPLMLGLARGLQHSLGRGVTHRDIKPTNILISSSGQAKLVDFGLATIEGDERKLAQAHGQRTIDYSALERTCGSQKGDPRSDIYFLGCVFYQMLTGRLPLPEVEADDMLAKMLKRSFGAIKPISEMDHAPAEALSRIIEKMMKMELVKRYQNMDDVVRDLESYYLEMTGQAPPKVESEEEQEFDIERLYMTQRHEESAAKAAEGSSVAVGEAQLKVEQNDEGDFELGAADRGREGDVGFEIPAFQRKRVLCVEAQDLIRDAFRKTLSRMGYRVLIVGDAGLAAERFREDPVDAVVFDIDGLGPNALEAFIEMHDKAHDDGQELHALVLLGPRQGNLASKLPKDDRLVVRVKPIKMKDVQDALNQLAPLQAG
ncbi:serine/threonine protein kinase [Tautonia plasticadhaerens]|uniref:Serine/threonine-protein kinase StkP n=1 Tax=Tautonia plasticadhaerens TaxID=2527974 RepID=A0A518GW16_9BACT|nr:serine/threonine-protein kinase [Tautonia plasticadhaerens]QDV32759.1 Serine/threonine-protein kinase StkP [Tautonia plasticadhaerens]